MQPVLSLVPAAILVLATLAPGGAGAETTREGIRAGPELAQGPSPCSVCAPEGMALLRRYDR